MIINSFNERWFQDWEATPDEQRIKIVNIVKKVEQHPDYVVKYLNNSDTQNREIAFGKIFDEVMAKQRRIELELYRLISSDESSKSAMVDTIKRILQSGTFQ